MLNSGFVAEHNGEKVTSVQDDLKERLLEDTFRSSLPSLLRYEDKNTMRFSIEGRVPFVDKELLKFLFTLDESAIIHDGWNKRILRESMDGILPDMISKRRNKIGFTTPEGSGSARSPRSCETSSPRSPSPRAPTSTRRACWRCSMTTSPIPRTTAP